MCTASWSFRESRLELFFNRDEKRTRARAEEPAIRDRDGVQFLAPIDADAGGTWISANEWGVVLALLNAPDVVVPPTDRIRSRGSLVRELARARSTQAASSALLEMDLSVFRGFRIAFLAVEQEPLLAAWDGREIAVTSAVSPLASSSLRGLSGLSDPGADAVGGVEDERRRQFEGEFGKLDSGKSDVEFLEAFHRTHAPVRGPLSVCMHREDARTVSSTHVSVDANSVRMRYADGSPCEVPFRGAWELARRTPEKREQV